MSEAPNEYSLAASSTAGAATLNTVAGGAGNDVLTAAAAAPAANPLVASVAAAVAPTTTPSNYGATVAAVLQTISPFVQAAENIGRASVKTQTWVAIGEMAIEELATAVDFFFPHPNA